MYLKSIEVQGFKSFANKILFEFHPGITGIVGPNGSGKSNVADAVRWVLGEQSARQLRGASMQDVIFSGTENRKPLGLAWVAITLDNSDHKLPVEYEEVTVTRRVYRSGESEYLINGRACRLKDVHELFYDTGIGKEGYSIIGQGQIDKILSGRPEERRELFDEAAGIVKFKRRKMAAQKKLEDEHANLLRVNDILSELSRQLEPMEAQAEKAKVYLKKREELKEYDVNLFLLELEEFQKKEQDADKKLSDVMAELESLKKAYESAKTGYEQAEQEIQSLSRQMEEEKEAAGKSELRGQQLKGQIQVFNEQIHTAEITKEHLKSRTKVIEQELKNREKQETGTKAELETLHTQLEQIQKEFEETALECDALTADISHLEGEISDGKNQLIGLLNGRSSTKMRLERYDTMLEQAQIRKAELSQKILKLKSEETEQAEEAKKRRELYESISQGIETLGKEAAGYEAEAEKIRQEMILKNQQLEKQQTAYHREASRLESLKNLTERYDGYGNSIRRVMEQKSAHPGILGVVADLIKTEKKYETAIETALGGSIQNIVTKDEETAKSMIEFLKKNKYGRATFLPLTSMTARGGSQEEKALKENGVVGMADSLVSADGKYQTLVRYLLGRTLVVDHIDHAIAIARKYRYSLRIVTLEGESLSPGGSMTGGAFKNAGNLLGRRREIESLGSEVAAQKAALEALQKALEEKRVVRGKFRDKIVAVQETLQKEYLRQNTVRMEIAQMEAKGQETRSGYAGLKSESEEIEQQMLEIRGEKKKIEAELRSSQEEEEQITASLKVWQEDLEKQKEASKIQARIQEEIHVKAAGIGQKEEFLRQERKRIQGEIREFQKEREQVKEQTLSQAEVVLKKKEAIKNLEKEAAKEERLAHAAREQMEKWREKKETLSGHYKALYQKREELSEQKGLLDKECFRLESQKEKVEEAKEGRIQEMWETYELSAGHAAEFRKEIYQDAALLRKSIQALKEEIRSLGNVNVNAIEAFQELSKRHGFLKTQQEDLVEAEGALERIIAELDEGMRSQFTEKFAQIQAEFDKVFKQLFGGGKGSLDLVEEEDLLEAGIRIIAQPPGKKLQNMMQLSGGEKALTAIALLFAIQNLKPSPFCLLDEIEAALDESNVSRYANYLHKLTKNTQFIIITHRRGTMAVADRLYGITMQEKGISALVSVNLIQDDLDE